MWRENLLACTFSTSPNAWIWRALELEAQIASERSCGFALELSISVKQSQQFGRENLRHGKFSNNSDSNIKNVRFISILQRIWIQWLSLSCIGKRARRGMINNRAGLVCPVTASADQ